MPTYDYECDACGHTFEHFQSINDPLLRKCPECGKQKLRRLIGSGAAVVFKGSGFYQTDYRSDSYKKGAEKDKKKSESGGKSDAKPESKTEGSKSEGSKSESKSDSSSSKMEKKSSKKKRDD